MTNTLLEKLIKKRNKIKLKKINPNLLPDPTTNIPAIDSMEELAIELRDYFFKKRLDHYLFKKQKIVSYQELEQAFIDLEVVKNYQEFNKIAPTLNNLKIKYDSWWQACQLEITRIKTTTKKIEENQYILIKKKAPFPKETKIENPNKIEKFSINNMFEEN